MVRASGFARAALAGNPSDGYGGAVLAVSLEAWRAQVEAELSEAVRVEPVNSLVRATVDRFRRELAPAGPLSSVRWMTSIPQRVGLGSSSALVIAVTRALSRLHGVELPPTPLAEFALSVETEELGIAAGLQDRVVQAHEGLMFMDFGEPPQYERLDRRLLPPLVIAWREETAGHSGDVHRRLRDREGDELVQRTMRQLAGAARSARSALLERDPERFAGALNSTFDLRRQLMDLDPLCVEVIEAARAAGAGANYTGSGGAIVAACRDEAHADTVHRALARMGCGVTRVG